MTRLVQLFVFPVICFSAAMVPAAIAPIAAAHSASSASAEAKVDREGRFKLRVHFDLIAFVSHQSGSHSSHDTTDRFFEASDAAIDGVLIDAKARFIDALRVTCGDVEASIETVVFPTVQEAREIHQSTNKPHHSLMVDVTVLGRVPESAEQIAFGFPAAFDQLVLTVDRPGEAFHVEALEHGSMSSTLTLHLDAPLPSKLKTDASMTVVPSLEQEPSSSSFLIDMLTDPVGVASTIICATMMVMLIWIVAVHPRTCLPRRKDQTQAR